MQIADYNNTASGSVIVHNIYILTNESVFLILLLYYSITASIRFKVDDNRDEMFKSSYRNYLLFIINLDK